MTFSQAIARCMGKYGTFSGRASKGEFWWFALFVVLMQWGATLVDTAYYGALSDYYSMLSEPFGYLSDPDYTVWTIVTLAFVVPFLAAGSRRLHDTGRSGWWQLLLLTGIGVIILAFMWAAGSKSGSGGAKVGGTRASGTRAGKAKTSRPKKKAGRRRGKTRKKAKAAKTRASATKAARAKTSRPKKKAGRSKAGTRKKARRAKSRSAKKR